ncbi:hypothetical protein HY605_02660 [Candidatus Peregrinibacteria bacterium]|nr:hypothetical protein [Candidatus Peregrinibacteria bacterium]
MATTRQMEANKQNALLGGVKTDAGKKTSRQNAIKHSFFSKLATDFDNISCEDFSAEMYQYFSPANIFEAQLVEIILSNMLAYRRICLFESQLVSSELQKAAHGDLQMRIELDRSNYQNKFRDEVADELLKIKRYKICAFNMITKAGHELERLTRMRNGENVPFPAVCDINISAK